MLNSGFHVQVLEDNVRIDTRLHSGVQGDPIICQDHQDHFKSDGSDTSAQVSDFWAKAARGSSVSLDGESIHRLDFGGT